MITQLDNFVRAVMAVAVRNPLISLTTYAVAFALSLASIVFFIGVDTDSSKMISSELSFKKRNQAFNRDFEGIKNSVVVVIRADVPDVADAIASQLVEKLEKNDALTNVFAPSVSRFFKTHGLLYEDVEALEAKLSQLNKSASLLASLREESTLDNFFQALFTAEKLALQADFDLTFLDEFYGEVTETIKGRLEGRFVPLSWAQTSDPETSHSGEKTQGLLYATPVLNFEKLQPASTALKAIQEAIDSLPEDLKSVASVGLTGDPALRFEELKSVQKGIGLSLMVSLLLVGVLLFLAYRNLPQVVLTMAALTVTLVLSTGFAALFFGQLNLVSVAFVVLLVGLGLDFTIHSLCHLKDSREKTPQESIIAIGGNIGGALALGALTTAIAFLSFVPTDFSGIAQLGGIGAAGVVIAFLVAITFVPALLVLIPSLRSSAQSREDHQSKKSKSGALLYRMRWPLAVVLVVLLAASSVVIGDVRFDADPVALRDPNSPSMRALNLLHDKPETVPYRLSLLRNNEEEAQAAAQSVSKLPSVHRARVLSDFVPKDQDEKFELIDFAIPTFDAIVGGQGLDHASLPEGKTALQALTDQLAPLEKRPKAMRFAALLGRLSRASPNVQNQVEKDIFAFFPALIDTIEAQLDINNVTIDTLPDFFKKRFLSPDGRWRVDVVPVGDMTDPNEIADFVQSVEAFDAQAVGAPLQIVKGGGVVSHAMLVAFSLAMTATFLIALIVLRHIPTVLAIFIPLLCAGVLTAGASVFFSIPFNYANIIVLPLLIGLGVDSGIHVAIRRRRLVNSHALYESSTPRAVLFSGLTTIAAFATLGLSPHAGTASMGIMLALSITLTLAASVILTPILMDLFNKIWPSNQKNP